MKTEAEIHQHMIEADIYNNNWVSSGLVMVFLCYQTLKFRLKIFQAYTVFKELWQSTRIIIAVQTVDLSLSTPALWSCPTKHL